ncbi:Peptidoglycan-associated lipoprotein [Paraburkholderia caffeinitolerans]|uniref:Peptidoglycan-associated lipoprotein n=1 Tax=Paraburkholderia caffeinitolerans TaxID=1723730 RepID=A0A6J5G1C5_9BURK|nr:OmpA family protein [Paraburkholderia caffeinitolerans]CAB3791670.1 Peptidoglycan-associated lipoprotein [Paraburkholderia caffeinitolerans]
MSAIVKNLSQVRLRHAWPAALACCAIVLAGAMQTPAHAQVMKEKDITEQSVTKALTPSETTGDVLTRGFVLSNQQPGAMSAKAKGPAKAPSAQMLITFATNSTDLTSTARGALDKVARALQSDKLAAYKFRVEGHADPRGNADANMTLSQGRAQAVVDYLTQQDGIAAERLTAVGKGSSEPLNTRNPAAPENRRVTIVTVAD